MEGRQGSTVSLTIERQEAPDLIGHRKLKRLDVTICRGYPQPQAAESRPADGNTGRVVQGASPNKSHPPLSSYSAGTSSVPGSRYFGEGDADPSADPSASSVARAREACKNTSDAERSETPGGAYMRIPPGRSIPSPSIQSSLSLHGSRNSNDGAAGSFDVQGAQLDGVRKLDVQGAQLDSIESSVNGRSKSSGSVRGNGMGMLGEGTEGMRIALRMLLTNLQSAHVPTDVECPHLSEEEGGGSYNSMISELFREVKKLKQQQEAAISLSRVIKDCAGLHVNDKLSDAMRAFDMVMQNDDSQNTPSSTSELSHHSSVVTHTNGTPSKRPSSVSKPPSSPVSSLSTMHVKSIANLPPAIVPSGIEMRGKQASADEKQYAFLALTQSCSLEKNASCQMSTGSEILQATLQFQTPPASPNKTPAVSPDKEGGLKHHHVAVPGMVIDNRKDISEANNQIEAQERDVSPFTSHSRWLSAAAADQDEQPIMMLRCAGGVQRVAAPAPVSSWSAASTARDTGAGKEENYEQIDQMPSEQQVEKFLETKNSDAQPEPNNRRLTPAGSIELLIKNYEIHGRSRSDTSDTNSAASGSFMPKVLNGLLRSPQTTFRVAKDEAVSSMPEISIAGGVVKERRERVEQLIKRSKELAEETSLALPREKMRTPTNKPGLSASTQPLLIKSGIRQPQSSDNDILDHSRPASKFSGTIWAPSSSDVLSITPRSLAKVHTDWPGAVDSCKQPTSTSTDAPSLPIKSPYVKSIDELRARHAQFKEWEGIPPAPLLRQKVSVTLSDGPTTAGSSSSSIAAESTLQPRWSSHPFGSALRSSAYIDDEETGTDQMCIPSMRQKSIAAAIESATSQMHSTPVAERSTPVSELRPQGSATTPIRQSNNSNASQGNSDARSLPRKNMLPSQRSAAPRPIDSRNRSFSALKAEAEGEAERLRASERQRATETRGAGDGRQEIVANESAGTRQMWRGGMTTQGGTESPGGAHASSTHAPKMVQTQSSPPLAGEHPTQSSAGLSASNRKADYQNFLQAFGQVSPPKEGSLVHLQTLSSRPGSAASTPSRATLAQYQSARTPSSSSSYARYRVEQVDPAGCLGAASAPGPPQSITCYPPSPVPLASRGCGGYSQPPGILTRAPFHTNSTGNSIRQSSTSSSDIYHRRDVSHSHPGHSLERHMPASKAPPQVRQQRADFELLSVQQVQESSNASSKTRSWGTPIAWA